MAGRVQLTKEQVEELKKLLDAGVTHETISENLGIPKGSVGHFAATYGREQKEHSELETMVFRQERTPERLIKLLERLPNMGEVRLDFARLCLEDNPVVLQNPAELYGVLVGPLQVHVQMADLIVKKFFADVLQQQPQLTNQFNLYGQHFAPPGANPSQNPYGGLGNVGAAGAGGMQMVQTPGGPVYFPNPQPSLTLDQVRRVIEEERESEFIEEEEPILVNGQPLRNPDGTVIMRHRRRPVNMAPPPVDPFQQMMTMVTLMKTMMDMGGSKTGTVDAQVQSAMHATELKLAEISARMEADRRISDERLDAQRRIADLSTQAAVAKAGLSPEAQVTMKGVEGAEKLATQVLLNHDDRMNRLERLATQVVVPLVRSQAVVPPAISQAQARPGPQVLVPVAPSDQDLQRLEASAKANGG